MTADGVVRTTREPGEPTERAHEATPGAVPAGSRASAAQAKAAVLREALPWITRFAGAVVVIKYGGNAMVDEELTASFAADVALLHVVGLRPVIVHGGGPQISALATELGLDSHFVAGLRVTDDDMLAVVRKVLLGEVNPMLVGLVQRAGTAAVGVSGTDAGLFTVTRVTGPDDQDLGRVGDVDTVDPRVVARMLDDGFLPVVASLGRDVQGMDHNVNADDAAGALAAALDADKLVYLTDVAGLYEDFGDGAGEPGQSGSLLSQVTVDRLRSMLEAGDVHAGMRPKVASMVTALDAGVRRAHILDGRVRHAVLLEVFTDAGVGTMVTTDRDDRWRKRSGKEAAVDG